MVEGGPSTLHRASPKTRAPDVEERHLIPGMLDTQHVFLSYPNVQSDPALKVHILRKVYGIHTCVCLEC